MKFILSFLILVGGSWVAQASPGPHFSKVEAGEISPFWLEAMTSQKNKDSKEQKQKAQISVKSFESMSKQVTVRDFKIFLEKFPKWKKNQVPSLMADESYLENLTRYGLNDLAPMTNVSWFAAVAYCESIGARLPTTNEWEYMAAASETQKDASSDSQFLNRILEWYGQPQNGNSKAVGGLYKNLYGIWDLHGNVWEWVSDFNSNFITGESREDSALNKDMFCGAGGLAGGNKENYAAFMRYAFRSSLKGKSSTNNLGFRCVRSL